MTLPDFPFIAVAARSAPESDEEPVVPGRVVPQVLLQQLVGVSDLALPDLRSKSPVPARGRRGPEMHEHPLSVRPGMVVLRVECERLCGKVELAGRVVKGEDDRAAVLPVEVRYRDTVVSWGGRACERVERPHNDVPDLIRLEVVLYELIEQVQLFREVSLHL